VPHESFQYTFNAPDQAVLPIFMLVVGIRELNSSLFQGTFWYHSHLRDQYCDGLRGALIIDDQNDPHKDLYDHDDGEVDILTDFSLG
jgi:iron transport multicopper oxidase